MLAAPAPFGAATSRVRASFVVPGTELTSTTLGVFTQLEYVDMLTTSEGFAVAAGTGPGRNRDYLVRTSDAGERWTTVAPLPLKSYVGSQSFDTPTLQFVNRDVGYLDVSQGPVFVTTNGGASWSKLVLAGIWPNLAISDSTVTVTSDVCTGTVPNYGPLKCPSQIERFHLDATTPFSSFRVPKRGATNYRAVVELSTLSARTDVVAEGGGEGGNSSLLETVDGGASWRLLADPCEGLMVLQLLTTAQGDWLLNCFMGGGMNQGTHQLWQSDDHGSRWTVVAKSNEEGNQVGNIGDVTSWILYSGDKRILFGLVGGAGGGVTFSTNGGSRWQNTTVDGFDGVPAVASTFGRTGAVVTVAGGPTYVTSNGITWSTLPRLPLGSNPVSSLCTNENNVVAKVAGTGAAAGTSYVTILFTNVGTPACWLHGIPSVQPVAGANDIPVGPEATRIHVPGRGGTAMLRVFGGKASITVGIETAVNYPKRSCAPENMNRLHIQFSQATYFVTIGVNQVCTKFASTNNAGVVAGIVGGP